jgi:hypothetical protein
MASKPSDHFGTTETVMPRVPGKDWLGFALESTMRKHGVIDTAAHNAGGCRGLEGVGVFLTIEGDDGEPFR